MEYVTERESTKRAPMRPVEVNYVNADIHGAYEKYTVEVEDEEEDDITEYVINDPDVFNKQSGFQFTFPSKWATYPSTNKLVGIRRLFYWPCPVCFGCQLYLFDNDVDEIDTTNLEFDDDDGCYTYTKTENEKEVEYYYEPTLQRTMSKYVTLSSNFGVNDTIYDIISQLSSTINDELKDDGDEATYTVQLKYDVDDLTFTMSINKNETNADIETVPFKLIFNEEYNHYAKNFLRLFNQPTSTAMVTTITKPIEESLTFTNVWNRDDLFFHASFSDSPRQLIGYQNDTWSDANVYYGCNVNSDDFTIRFTQDGVNKVLPRNGTLLIQFSLIYNYDHSFLM